jgi:hypothetical protein
VRRRRGTDPDGASRGVVEVRTQPGRRASSSRYGPGWGVTRRRRADPAGAVGEGEGGRGRGRGSGSDERERETK